VRSDLHKVIVERPRLGSRMPNHKTAMRLRAGALTEAVARGDDYDSGASRASSARRDKRLNENLAPLTRYLRSQVGRPWNKVYGEVCAAIDTRSAVGLHVLQHIPDIVTTKTFAIGKVVYSRWWGMDMPVDGLYVDPRTGLLRHAQSRRSRPVQREGNLVRVSEGLEFQKRDGLWFRMEYRTVDQIRMLEATRQCDRKTIRQIERGDWGEIEEQCKSRTVIGRGFLVRKFRGGGH